MNLKYTLCFVRDGDHLLMLNRRKAPNMGLWNGIGGRIEKGETPRECVIREVEEESGWAIQDPRFAGIVTWTEPLGAEVSGMYVYVADVHTNWSDVSAESRSEGIIAWCPVDWVMDRRNSGVVSNIPAFLPHMLAGAPPSDWHCTYKNGKLDGMYRRALNINLEGVQ